MTFNDAPGIALITGGCSGIGAEYADRLARRGYDLLLVSINELRLKKRAARLSFETGRRIEVISADLTDPADLARIEQRLATDDAINVLVNNAGLSLNGGVLQSSPAQIANLIALNVTATTVLAAAAAKAFRALGRGAIINMASASALAPEHADAAYSGSKAYLVALTLRLAADLKDSGVRLQAVLPGAVRTEIWERSGKDVDALFPGRVMEVGDLVDAALVGFDRLEVVTVPSLADEGLLTTYETARLALAPNLTTREVAARYRPPST